MKSIFCLAVALFSVSSIYGQYNLTPEDRYLSNPFVKASQEQFDEVVIKKAGNRPPDYFSLPRDGYVILLDSNVIYGKIKMYGRCVFDIYGIILTSSDTVETKFFKQRSSYYNLNKSSLIAWGLKDRSENDTPDRFEWQAKFPIREYSNGTSGIDTGRFISFIKPIYGFAKSSFLSEGDDLSDDQRKILLSRIVETTKPDYGYIETVEGNRFEGFVQLNRVNGVITDIRVSKDLGRGAADPQGLKVYLPHQVKLYGLNEKKEYAGKLNETPSSFKWGMQVPNTIQRSTKKEDGYIELPDGRVLKGTLEMIAENDEAQKIRFREEGAKARETNIYPFDRIIRFGLSNVPKDQSVNETPEEFVFKTKMQLGNSNPSLQTSNRKPGYVETIDGKNYKGDLQVDREYGFITQIEIKTENNGKVKLVPYQVKRYGFNVIKKEPVAPPVAVNPDELPDDVMRPATRHIFSSRLSALPYAKNEAKSEISQKYYQWTLGSGSAGKWSEKSAEADGYVILKNGQRIDGQMEIKRMVTKIEKYKIVEFKVKNDDGKNKFDASEVKAYGLNGIDSGVKKIKPGDRVRGFLVAKDAKVIKRPTNFGGYKTDPKAGYVQSADGEVQIGLISVRQTASGRIDVTLQDYEGEEQEFKGILLSYGWFEIEPFSEFPNSVYSWNSPGYIELLDGTYIEGQFRGDLSNIEEDGTEELYDETVDPCAQGNAYAARQQRERPPLNKFFSDVKEAKMSYIENSDQIKNVFDFKIKTENGKEVYQYDQVRAYGATNVFMNRINKNGLLIYEDDKMNFHRGSLTLEDGEQLNGWIAHLKKEGAEEYYGVYFTKAVSEPVVVYRMDELEKVNQNIVDFEEYDPLEEEFLASKETSSTFDKSENATLILTNGDKKTGNITIEIPPKSWYANSVIYTDAQGVQEVYDKDNPLDKIILNDSVKTTYKYFRGAFVEVVLEEGPFYYFRNPFPSIRNSASKVLNWMKDKALAAGNKALADAMAQSTLKSAQNMDQLEAGLKASETIRNMDSGNIIDFEMFKKEYTVYDVISDRNFIILPQEIGGFTKYPQYDDLKNGCLSYLELDRKEAKALGDVDDIKTGEGLLPSLQYLKECYYPGQY